LSSQALNSCLASTDVYTVTYNLSQMAVDNTVGNIQNLAIHEIRGHIMNGYNEAIGRHAMAYTL